MAVPKKKTSKSRRNMRRSHHALKPVHAGACSNCGSVKLPHHICTSCGYYNNKLIVASKIIEEEDESSNDDEN